MIRSHSTLAARARSDCACMSRDVRTKTTAHAPAISAAARVIDDSTKFKLLCARQQGGISPLSHGHADLPEHSHVWNRGRHRVHATPARVMRHVPAEFQ